MPSARSAGLRCKRYSDPHIGDMKKFIRRKLQHIKESTDTSDLAGMEECFLQQTMDMDEAVGMMKVNLVNSGMRSPKEMLKHYGKVGTKKMVPVKEVGADGKTVEVQLSVEEKIRRWMMWKYADEIDCVIVKTEEEVRRKPSAGFRFASERCAPPASPELCTGSLSCGVFCSRSADELPAFVSGGR